MVRDAAVRLHIDVRARSHADNTSNKPKCEKFFLEQKSRLRISPRRLCLSERMVDFVSLHFLLIPQPDRDRSI